MFLWSILTNPAERRQLFHMGWKDIGRIIVVAIVLDTVYQLVVLRSFYVVQALIVALGCAIVPYALFRGLTTRLTRDYYRNQVRLADTTETGRPKNQDCVDT